jgi:hypothetical protein
MKKIILILFAVLLFSACDTGLDVNMPPKPAYFALDLTMYVADNYLLIPEDMDRTPMAQLQVVPGKAGLIFFKSVESLNGASYNVFDRCCRNPECEEKSQPVVMKDDNWSAKCPVCGSEYLLIMGSGEVTKGPAKKPLYIYPNIKKYGDELILDYTPKY